MQSLPLVSIVIPAYNHGRYLDEAIRSVLQQDYPRVELLVFDDGSTDETRAVLEKYGRAFYWETQTNIGQAATLNKGWGMSRGEILGYLSADDSLLPQAVSTSVDWLKKMPEAVLTYPDFNVLGPDSRVLRTESAPEYSYRDMVVDIVCAPGPGVFFRRSAFEAAGGWDGSLRQIPDYEFWLRLGLQGAFLHIPRVLASFRVHEQSQSFAKSDQRKAEELLRVMPRFLSRPDLPAEVSASRRQALGHAYLLTARLHWRAGRYGIALMRMVQALATFPGLLARKRTLHIVLDATVNRLRDRIAWRRSRNR